MGLITLGQLLKNWWLWGPLGGGGALNSLLKTTKSTEHKIKSQ